MAGGKRCGGLGVGYVRPMVEPEACAGGAAVAPYGTQHVPFRGASLARSATENGAQCAARTVSHCVCPAFGEP